MIRLALALVLAFALPAPAAPVPRTVLAFYDSRTTQPADTRLHQMAELPLNHLGLEIDWHDLRQPLPDPDRLKGMRGILTWWQEGDTVPDPLAFIAFCHEVLDRGGRLVVMDDPGLWRAKDSGMETPFNAVRDLMARIGAEGEWQFVSASYRQRYLKVDPRMVGFDHPLTTVPPHFRIRAAGAGVRSWLTVGTEETQSDLILTGPRGGYGYVALPVGYVPGEDAALRIWVANPLRFFREAFGTDDLPKPDTTTLSGRRLYYSHIDGDGWNSLSEDPAHRGKIAAQVVLEQAIAPFPELPVTVGAIAAELHEDWQGLEASRRAAEALYALPQVEAGTHTWTHPFRWRFFATYSEEREERYVERYRAALGGGARPRTILDYINPFRARREAPRPLVNDQPEAVDEATAQDGLVGVYALPRAYLDRPFDLTQEIIGSARYIERYTPPGKRVEIVQWSGDVRPFEAALTAARVDGLANINGGDSRYDSELPSMGFVAPLSRQVGAERQIYASMANENVYTELWTNRFYGFRHLLETVRNTGSPVRIKPFNLYYHMYSGSKEASAAALLTNIQAARATRIAPVTTTRFARLVEGFFSAELTALGADRWRIEGRGALNTLRFDAAALKAVDLARSDGVIGQTHHQGSLYVALDPAVDAPVVALTDHAAYDQPPPASVPYLIEGRWALSGLRRDGAGLAVEAEGFGPGEMTWYLPEPGPWRLTASRAGVAPVTADLRPEADGRAVVSLPISATEGALALTLAPCMTCTVEDARR